MAFTKKIWVNVPDPSNPPSIPEGQAALARFDAENMNRIEEGLEEACKLVPISRGGTGAKTESGAANSLKVKSIGSGIAIKENDDLNAYTTLGNYVCSLVATASTLKNCPVSGAFVMTVGYATGDSTYLYQEIIRASTGTQYYRSYVASTATWSAWQAAYSTSNKPTAEDVGALSKTIVINNQDILEITKDGLYYSTRSINVPTSEAAGYVRVQTNAYSDYRVVYWRPYNSTTEYANVFKNGTWLGWNGILTDKGGTLTNHLEFNNLNAFQVLRKGRTIGDVNHYVVLGTSSNGASTIEHYTGDVLDGRLELMNVAGNTAALILRENSGGKQKALFGEHNKPSGSYIGNGSDTKRTINVGGVGSILGVWCLKAGTSGAMNIFGYVHPAGMTMCPTEGSDVVSYTDKYISFKDGILTISTASMHVNQNGIEYYYQVL